MHSPDGGPDIAALEWQLAILDGLSARLQHARGAFLPGNPEERWKGQAQAAYEARLGELTGVFDLASRAVESARREIVQAICAVSSVG